MALRAFSIGFSEAEATYQTASFILRRRPDCVFVAQRKTLEHFSRRTGAGIAMLEVAG
jgi:hypothetical protein